MRDWGRLLRKDRTEETRPPTVGAPPTAETDSVTEKKEEKPGPTPSIRAHNRPVDNYTFAHRIESTGQRGGGRNGPPPGKSKNGAATGIFEIESDDLGTGCAKPEILVQVPKTARQKRARASRRTSRCRADISVIYSNCRSCRRFSKEKIAFGRRNACA